MSTKSDSDLEETIARYCAAHPNAADSADGVQRWWIGDPTIPLVDVETALEALVKRGVLDVRRIPGGSAVYFKRRS